MSRSAVVRARMEPDLKENAEAILQRLGLNATQAITLFYRQVELRNGLPFDIAIPSETTKRTFDATDGGRDLVLCEDVEDLFGKLGI
ncbi:MAG: type II toxin-antitoxin system RelB/DinJ family antitoxin [Candidatus Hydrogenedentes bacterium]|nr:type II toxin-antitoxin system RelB/DinJ family antitoxin [Candidatus Hydrogenedentota bacterium]